MPSNPLSGDTAAVPDGGHRHSHEAPSERHRCGDGSGGAAAEMVGTAPVTLLLVTASNTRATAANHERRHMSAFACTPMGD